MDTLDFTRVYRKSFVAYIKQFLKGVIGFFIVAFFSSLSHSAVIMTICLACYVVAYLTISFATLRSYKLYINENGVWLFSGIFPWTKIIQGIEWQDCGGCSFDYGFIPYICKSYNISVLHKFTFTHNMNIADIANGAQFATMVNHYLSLIYRGVPKNTQEEIIEAIVIE